MFLGVPERSLSSPLVSHLFYCKHTVSGDRAQLWVDPTRFSKTRCSERLSDIRL
ncbi:hypothetical protein Q8A73_023126 [Channa argus]|nr:hypothetical protein Q8A73_023126 [Channa argus]